MNARIHLTNMQVGLRDRLALFHKADYDTGNVLTYLVSLLHLESAGEQLLLQFTRFHIYINIFF